MIKIIVAVEQNNGIGMNGQIPWYIPADMRRFKQLTTGNSVIMGRHTFESIKNPLPDRINAVITSKGSVHTAVLTFKTLKEAVSLLTAKGKDIWLIGGERIYKEALESGIVDEIYMTSIEGYYECDTYFPKIDSTKWELIDEELPNVTDTFCTECEEIVDDNFDDVPDRSHYCVNCNNTGMVNFTYLIYKRK